MSSPCNLRITCARRAPPDLSLNAPARFAAALALVTALVAGCTSQQSWTDRATTADPSNSATPLLPHPLVSLVKNYCTLANEAAPYVPPTNPSIILESIERRVSADKSMLVALAGLHTEPGWSSLDIGFIQPLSRELEAVTPIVTKLDATVVARDTVAFNSELDRFQSTATAFEPAVDSFLKANGLTACQPGAG